MGKPITVLVVDDSALVREVLSRILDSDPGIHVVGTAHDPFEAREKIKALNPDVVTLDIEMPRMDGLSFLEKIMRLRPMPVVMVSTLTQKGADATVRALEMGAVDFVAKPLDNSREAMEAKAAELIAKVRIAARARVGALPRIERHVPGESKGKIAPSNWARVVAIGASTGGVEALKEVVCSLPADCPPVLITQHMPGHFTTSFARRLEHLSEVFAAEAKDGDPVLPGHVYVAPGDFHLELANRGGRMVCHVYEAPTVSGHRPSVDVLFSSVARVAGARAVGVILTGMGRDGARGMKEMRDAGAHTIGQDEATCVVYGMPRVAHEVGAVQTELPLSKIAAEILKTAR